MVILVNANKNIMSTFTVGTQCRLNENGKWVECRVTKAARGQVQIRYANGRMRWLDSSEVKKSLTTVAVDDEEDSSTSSSDEGGAPKKSTSSDDEKRLRANKSVGADFLNDMMKDMSSTYVREADDAEDVYTQLRDEWAVGSLVEIWSDSGSRWVVAQIMKFEKVKGYDEETVIVLYRIENADGSITTISKRVLITSQHLRPFVNKPSDPSDVNARIQELQVINDEFLLTIDHQSETMAQLQTICGELQREKEDQEATIADLEATINKQSKIIAQLMASLEDNEDVSEASDSEM